jgi:hypothetical protein
MCPAVWHSVCPYVQRRSRFFFFFFFFPPHARDPTFLALPAYVCTLIRMS